MAALMMNHYTWSQDSNIGKWLVGQRLDAVTKMIASVREDDVGKQAILGQMHGNVMPAMGKLKSFIAQLS